MKTKPMFPFRRHASKKRARGRSRDGRRLPSNPAELLKLFQPATKALAQVLAGHAKPSGQIVHARNVLAQAERLVADRSVERLPPAKREEFLEQFARLKLTVADYENSFGAETPPEAAAEEEPAEETAERRPAVSPEKLRALALSLAASTQRKAEPAPPAPNGGEAAGATPTAAGSDEATAEEPVGPGGRRKLRLRLGERPAEGDG